MAIQGWDGSVYAALRRLREAGALIDTADHLRDRYVRELLAAAEEILDAVPPRVPHGDWPADLAEVRLLAGSIVMAARHQALGSVVVADAIDRLGELIGG